jgi:excinuclease ABC subunit C
MFVNFANRIKIRGMSVHKEKPNLTRGTEAIQTFVRHLTSQPGVYRMMDEEGVVLYVGKAKNLKNRVTSYTRPEALSKRIQRMISLTYGMEFVVTHTEVEALLLEANLIKTLKPRFNILFRDDKSFPYILLTEGEYPSRLLLHRGAKTIKGTYFGPFASTQSVSKTLEILSRVFKLRTCTDRFFDSRTRPCLQYYIKRCTAPCVQKVTDAAYAEQGLYAKQFLQGKTQDLQKALAKEMAAASVELNYERAKDLRDQIQALTKIQEEQGIYIKEKGDIDVISLIQKEGKTAIQVFFFRYGCNYGNKSYFPAHDKEDRPSQILSAFISWFYTHQDPPSTILLSHSLEDQDLLQKALGPTIHFVVPKKGVRHQLLQQALKNAEESLASRLSEKASVRHLLEGVGKLFGLGFPPKRIEVYDNSHVQGKYAYGAMIVTTEEGFQKKNYRLFKIREGDANSKGGDDYAMMREVLTRRFHQADPENFPDLILLDGGQGQLNVGLRVLESLGLNIPIVAIAKGPERNAGKERFFMKDQTPFSLEMTNPVLHYLQRLRDESHRFVIGSHRRGRQKGMSHSKLEEIPGIGARRKKDLLQHFGSLKAISEAGVKDLQKVEGISEKIAQIIYDWFR